MANTLTVAQVNTQLNTRVNDITIQADAFLDALVQLAGTNLTTSFNIESLIPESYQYAQPPAITFPVFSAVAPVIDIGTGVLPEAPASTEFSEVAAVPTPDLTAVAPTLTLPTLPSSALPPAPSGAPEFVSPDIPTVPTFTLPTVPTFAALALPDAPSINLPSFSGSLPPDDLLVPSNTFAYAEAAYDSVLLDPLKAKLLDNLLNGGYGIETADEQALFQRMRDREAGSAMTRIDEAGRALAARGFPLPPGELSITIDRSYQAMQDAVSAANREITLERSKLFVENRQFTITEVRGIETVLINFHNSVQERALNVAKATLEASLAIYDALVKRYQTRLQAYQAEATAFAERIRGELAKAEIYRTQIQAAGLQVEMQKSLVDVYRAQLDGIQASVSIYRTQMEGANIRAQIERQKLEAWKAQIDGYTAQVQAKVAEFNMYRAGVDGQVARMSIYEAEVRAFGTQVQAAKTRSDTQLGVLQAQVEQARVKLANYQAEIEGFKAGVERQLATGRLQVDVFRANIDSARAQTEGGQANAQLQQEGMLRTTQQNTEISRMAIANAQAKLDALIKQFQFRMDTLKYGGDKYFTQLIATLNSLQGLTAETTET